MSVNPYNRRPSLPSAGGRVAFLTLGAGTDQLSTYEKGTWTPLIRGMTVAGSNTYTTQVGTYLRIGDLVFVQGYIVMSAKGGTMSGDIRISNLPFAVQNVTNGYGAGSVGFYTSVDLGAGKSQLGILIFPGTTAALALYENGDNTPGIPVVDAAISNSTAIGFSAVYRAA